MFKHEHEKLDQINKFVQHQFDVDDDTPTTTMNTTKVNPK